MMTLSFTDFRQTLADSLTTAQSQPVKVTRRSAPDMVVITADQFAELQQAKFDQAMARVMGSPKNNALFKTLADK